MSHEDLESVARIIETNRLQGQVAGPTINDSIYEAPRTGRVGQGMKRNGGVMRIITWYIHGMIIINYVVIPVFLSPYRAGTSNVSQG
jgi:hypothetical protein